MNADYEKLDATASQALLDGTQKSPEELRVLLATLNTIVTGGRVAPEELEMLARVIEVRYAVSMGLGATVDDGDFEPWLDEAKKGIDPYYWTRYKKYLVADGLPPDVVTKLDIITDQILSRTGNPRHEVPWDRRGMVVGHVQSGKTANYTGLICKAADAGYRLIIIIAGIHNNLRNQTQQRIDEGFIGRDTAKRSGTPKLIGVGKYDDSLPPVSLTTALLDFNKNTATTNGSGLGSYKVPVVLVIKKNTNTLRNLIEWLQANSAKGKKAMIDQPMLLIDDEADNASINTKYKSQSNLTTTINGQIRDLLQIFHRSCYVGYTATPFANIFIDPDQDDELYGEDLFPKHFIVGLDAPSNYFGGTRIFLDGIPDEGRPEYLRYIEDNEDILPITHKIDHIFNELPQSLLSAVRAFLLAKTIRNLRGQREKHSSMLVNASRFTSVQGHIRNRLHDALNDILDAVRVNSKKGQKAFSDPEIAALHRVWKEEFEDVGFTWDTIISEMYEAIAAAKVIEVNSSRNGLDYSSGPQVVIAVGGFSLSRGLTLEGLTTTWFLRNTKMYDTLMQMGRWFGYRTGYQDLCRIWMPQSAIAWYSHIADATDELHRDLRQMQKAKLTPLDFGLAVRSHPKSLLVTARNKLGSGKKTVSVGLSSQFVETARVDSNPTIVEENRNNARTFITELALDGFTFGNSQKVSGGFLLQNVSVEKIDGFLNGWTNAEANVTTQVKPIRTYINERRHDELDQWDVLIGSLSKGDECNLLNDWPVIPMERSILFSDLGNDFLSIGGSKMRVSSRGVERVGILEIDAQLVEAEFKRAEKHTNYPGKIYRDVRTRPLLALYLVKIKEPDQGGSKLHKNFPKKPIIAWAISFPRSSRPNERVEYIINTTKQKEIFGEDDFDEEEVNET